VRASINPTVVRNASALAAIARSVGLAVRGEDDTSGTTDSRGDAEMQGSGLAAAAATTTVVSDESAHCHEPGGGLALVNETGAALDFLAREVGSGGWGRDRAATGSQAIDDDNASLMGDGISVFIYLKDFLAKR